MDGVRQAQAAAAVWLQVSAVCAVLGFLRGDGLVGPVAFASLVLSCVLLYQCTRYRVCWWLPLVQALSLLCCSAAMLYLLGWSEESRISLRVYSHIEGAVYWAMIYPLALMVLVIMANLFDQRYNRILIGGFAMFISLGICVLCWVFVSVFCSADLDVVYGSTQEMAYLFVNLVLSVVQFLAISRALKGKGRYIEREEIA